MDNEKALAHWGPAAPETRKKKVSEEKLFHNIIQYNIKYLISPTIDVTFGKLLAIQSVTSDYQKTTGLKILAN